MSEGFFLSKRSLSGCDPSVGLIRLMSGLLIIDWGIGVSLEEGLILINLLEINVLGCYLLASLALSLMHDLLVVLDIFFPKMADLALDVAEVF